MKKRYSKPEIMFEDFSVSNSIAGGCNAIISGHSYGTCPYKTMDEFLGEVNIFIEDFAVCTTVEADGEHNGICYHVPYDNNLFNS